VKTTTAIRFDHGLPYGKPPAPMIRRMIGFLEAKAMYGKSDMGALLEELSRA
jgi:hypothetical protein